MSFVWHPISDKALGSITKSTARLNIWEGAVRSSKTVASLIRWIEFVKDGPDGPLLMIGKTERSLKRNILQPLSDIVGARRFRLNTGTGELRLCGRLVYLAGANDERAEQKIRGLTLAGAYGDELTLWPESFFKMLLSRLSVDGAALFGTTNPDSPYHWLKREVLDRKDDLDLQSWHFQLSDNLSLSPKYIEALKSEYTGLWRRRFIDGEWVQAEGSVYDVLDPDVHVLKTDPPAIQKYWVSCDYGTASVTVFYLIGLGQDNNLYFLDSLRWDVKDKRRQKTDLEFSNDLDEWLMAQNVIPENIFIPEDAASFRVQVVQLGRQKRDSGKRTALQHFAVADRSAGTVVNGIRAVSSLFYARRLFFSKKLADKGALREWQGYVWDEKAQARGEDSPLKENDHECDAGRYGIWGIRAIWQRWIMISEAA